MVPGKDPYTVATWDPTYTVALPATGKAVVSSKDINRITF